MEYESREANYCFEGGHFDSEEEVDRAHPNGQYVVDIVAPTVAVRDLDLGLAGTRTEPRTRVASLTT